MEHGCHLHKHCDHCTHYCETCGVTYCCKCGKQWPNYACPSVWPVIPILPYPHPYPYWYVGDPLPCGTATITYESRGIQSTPTCSGHSHL